MNRLRQCDSDLAKHQSLDEALEYIQTKETISDWPQRSLLESSLGSATKPKRTNHQKKTKAETGLL